jgi:diaminopimelate epimerase
VSVIPPRARPARVPDGARSGGVQSAETPSDVGSERLPTGIAFLKGHGTENDFVLLPDPDGTLVISASQVRALCDRHAGIGGDGVIRIAPAAADSPAEYFMDYRNADGSLAEMCGNGARLFARFLVDAGWVPPGRLVFDTRGGTRVADVGPEGDVTVGMGPARLGGETSTRISERAFSGVAVDVGNPHLVCLADIDLATLDLGAQPWFDPTVFPDGVNIEVATQVGPDRVAMRVHERGVGETRSCGTGTVAVAAAYLSSTGRTSGSVVVDVLGGSVRVDVSADGCTLAGPAVVVAAGRIDDVFWESHR